MKRFLRNIGRFFLLVILLLSILLVASFFLEEKITQKAIDEINKTINVPVYADNINFSLVRGFPKASLELENVTVLSSKKFRPTDFENSSVDTLIFAKHLYLSFNILSLLKNELELSKIRLEKARFNVLVDKKGNDNYNILNNIATTHDSTKEGLKIKLNEFSFKGVSFNYVNKFKNTEIEIFTDNYQVKGQFYKKNYSISTDGKLEINKIIQAEFQAKPKGKTILDLNLDLKNDTLIINKGILNSYGLNMGISGNIFLGNQNELDLKITGNNINIDELLKIAKPSFSKDFSAKGVLNLNAIVKGKLTKTNTPYIKSNFNIENASVVQKASFQKINNIYVTGSFTNGNKRNQLTTKIDIANIKLSTEKSFVTGSFSLQDLTNPYVTLNSNLDLSLPDLKNLFPSKEIQDISGKLTGEFTLVGNLNLKQKDFNTQLNGILGKGNFYLQNASFTTKKLKLNNVNADFSINNQLFNIKKIEGSVNHSDITGSAIISQFTSYLQNKSNLKIKTKFTANSIDYNNFKSFFQESDAPTDSVKIDVEADFLVYEFIKDNIKATRLSGRFKFIDENIFVDNFKLNAFGGTIFSKLQYTNKPLKRAEFLSYTKLVNIDIKILFQTFNNFKQDDITDKNLAGKLTSDFELQMLFKEGKVWAPSIDFMGHARIENGELNYFKPIMEASSFSEIKELENIKFSVLENDLLITNQVIHIPQMNIESNAFDITLQGKHEFSGDYEYHMKIFLSDFIKGKAQRLQKQQSEFGRVEDDGYGRKPLLLIAKNKGGVSEVQIDKEALKKNLKSGLKDEKRELKSILKKEFGWFRKDSTIKENNTKKAEFEIEWDEE